MTYFDDILNINAMLRDKMRRNAEQSQQLLDRIQTERAEYDTLMTEADALLAQAQALASQLGVELPEPPAIPEAPEESVSDCAELLVRLPDNYDFAQAFAKLRKEAHDAGFTNAHPEDLLSREEMAQAEAFHHEVDAVFEQETKLQGKDLFVLTAAVAARIICKMLFAVPLPKEDQEAVKAAQSDQTVPPLSADGADAAAALPVNAMQGVDLNALDLGALKNSTKTFSNTISQGEQMISRLTGRKQKTVAVKFESQIMNDRIPFDMPDNEFFARDDALGYNRWFGWIFGVLNIMTDTVTTKRMHSFSVDQSISSAPHPTIIQKISTPIHLLLPVMTRQNIKGSLLAAVVREAGVLKVTEAPPQDVAKILSSTFAAEEKNLALLQKTGTAAQTFSQKLGSASPEGAPTLDLGTAIWGITRDTAVSAFLNQLITAIHALMYDPDKDGPVENYTIRTNKVLTVSSTIATIFNSLPALIERNPAKIDFAGVITTCLSVFNSTRFWIDVKTNYLISAYQPKLDEQMAIVDKYFAFIPS